MCFLHVCTAVLPHPNLYLFNQNWCVLLCYMYNHTQPDAALHVLNVCAFGGLQPHLLSGRRLALPHESTGLWWQCCHQFLKLFQVLWTQRIYQPFKILHTTWKLCCSNLARPAGVWQDENIVMNVEPCHGVQGVYEDRGHSGFSEALNKTWIRQPVSECFKMLCRVSTLLHCTWNYMFANKKKR